MRLWRTLDHAYQSTALCEPLQLSPVPTSHRQRVRSFQLLLRGVGERRGDHRTYIRSGQHGRAVEQRTCPSCGTTVFWYGSMAPGMVAVAVGCFAEPTFPAPSLAAWCESKHAWLSFPSTIKTLDQQKA